MGTLGGTAVSTEKDDSMAEIRAFLCRKDCAELFFYFLRFLALGKTQTAADADTMGITDHAAGNTVQIAQQQIGSLATDTGNSQ